MSTTADNLETVNEKTMRIISGGQPGAGRTGLDAAVNGGFCAGKTAHKDYMSEMVHSDRRLKEAVQCRYGRGA